MRNRFSVLLCFLCIHLLMGQALASQEKLYQYLNLGEKPAPLYAGPISPAGDFDPLTGKFQFLDEVYEQDYLEDYLNRQFFELTDAWFHEFPLGSACSNFYLSQNIDYIRYLFRLITMSYTFEAMKATNVALHQLGFDRNECSLSWHQTFSKCEPRSNDMQKFVKRVQYRFMDDMDRSQYIRLSEKEKKDWINSLEEAYASKSFSDIAQSRVIGQCKKQDKNCGDLNSKDVRSLLEKSCQTDRRMIQKICSENDELYGLSYLDNAVELISRSNAVNVIDDGGHAESCLKRFVSLFERKEAKDHYLKLFFPVVKKDLMKKDKRYAQGSLFLPGALKEFDDRGLTDFLYRPEPGPEPVLKPEPKPEPVPVVVIKKPEPPPKPEPLPEPEPVVVIPEPEPEPSEFEKAYKKLVNTEAAKVALNMNEFKDDFIFTERMIKALKGPLKDYQTRVALKDMKKFERVGSREEPVRLIFLKFLIDNNMHQGLYNITAVLGGEFYVVNDIDGSSEPVPIELKNDKETNYRWEIELLREDIYTEMRKKEEKK